MPDANPSTKLKDVHFRLSESERERLDEIAYELGEPGDVPTRADLMREAVREYIRRHDEGVEMSPQTRGVCRPEEVQD